MTSRDKRTAPARENRTGSAQGGDCNAGRDRREDATSLPEPEKKKRKWKRWERYPRTKEVRNAGDAIATLIKHYKLGRPIAQRRVLTDWPEVVGDRIAAKTWPTSVYEGVLNVRVANSAWMQELGFLKEELMEKLRARHGKLVRDIRFTLGGPQRDAKAEIHSAQLRGRKRRIEPPPPAIAPATGADLERIRRETEFVDDDELRAIIFEARRRTNK